MGLINKPHPFIFNRFSVGVPALATFLVMLLLRPFEFAAFPLSKLMAWSAIFAILAGATVWLSVTVVKKAFPQTVEERWTVGREIALVLFVLAMIALVLFLLFLALNPQTDWWALFSGTVLRTMTISVFPLLVLVLFEQNHHQRVKRREAEALNQELLKKQTSLPQPDTRPTPTGKVILTAENQKPALQLKPEDLLLVKSEGNYVEVYYTQRQKTRKTLLRNSLKAIESQLPAAVFFRCHKSYLINLHRIQQVVGNARNLELILDAFEEKVPVSRSKSNTLLQRFQQDA